MEEQNYQHLQTEDLASLKNGFDNLDKHIENMKYFGFNPIVAVNRFDSDTDEELDLLVKHCKSQNVKVSINEAWAKGGEGAIELAEKVLESVTDCSDCYKPLYDLSWSFEEKIETICKKMYGADHVEYTVKAKSQLEKIEKLGLGNLAVCIAKTQKSLSDDQSRRGRPRGFTIKIREVELSSGAGFIVPIAGTIMRMPGLPVSTFCRKDRYRFERQNNRSFLKTNDFITLSQSLTEIKMKKFLNLSPSVHSHHFVQTVQQI